MKILKIKEYVKNMLHEFSSYEESKYAVNIMKKEKSPGLDGLPSEF